jgi:uncharacterized protein YfiM (DUF2279 family)
MDKSRSASGFVRSCFALTCLLTAIVTMAACSGSDAVSRPVESATTTPATNSVKPVTRPSAVGVSEGGLVRLPSGALNRELDTARGAGATWIRIDIDWSIIEPSRGTQDWAATDRVVQAARSRGLAVLGLLTYSPKWAQDPSVPSDTSHGRPATPELFGAFAARAAKHYSDEINTWEIWNEPNLGIFFEPRPDVGYYTALLRASYDALHAVSPTVTVVAGSLASAVDHPNGKTIAPISFVDRMYAAGAKASLDAVSVHPYSYPALPSDGRTTSYNTFQQIPALHATMQRYGDGAKLLWLTEFGAPTATVRTGTGAVPIDGQLQATIIADGLRAATQLGYIGPVFIYSIRDERTGDPDILKNFGIVRSDFTPKASYQVIQRYAGNR